MLEPTERKSGHFRLFLGFAQNHRCLRKMCRISALQLFEPGRETIRSQPKTKFGVATTIILKSQTFCSLKNWDLEFFKTFKEEIDMGKGDRRTKRGKLFRKSYGVKRPRKKKTKTEQNK